MKRKRRLKTHVKKGDTVRIISGNYRGNIGKIIRVFPKTSQIIISNFNLKVKHVRPKQAEDSGQIISFEAPIHSSNVQLYSTNKQVSSRYKIIFDAQNNKYRKLNKTEEIIK